MSGLAGAPANLRLVQPSPEEERDAGVEVEIVDGPDIQNADPTGKILEIEHDDGSITISLDGRSLVNSTEDNPPGWWDNLVDHIDPMELTRIAEDLLRGVRDDMDSRQEWIEARATGLKLLGLAIEIPGLGSSVDGAPVEGMSRVRHPLLLEAILRFQANARGELLPVDGPVKIRNDDNNAELREDQLANALQRDLNHYLTTTATEYYPDTDRMLLMLGFGGTAFKKVYFCPLRNRPVSETVDSVDLIVNNAATDLQNARRVTHRVYMKPSTVTRLQILGVYRDIELGTPLAPQQDEVQREKARQQGVRMDSMNPEDRDREIYEIYCELDVKGHEHKHKGKITGLEIPYRVTIDVSSREVLAVVRNYDEPKTEKDLPDPRQVFVKYTYVPGFGFYDIGLLHILGNTTNAITAAWREMLDAGMFSSFPGFLMADVGARQNTNLFRVPPGGGALVKTGGLPINQAIMPLPYKDPSQALMNLVTNMAETGARVGNTAELQVGEGRADIPVGTVLAMIEQAQKVLNAVHKRNHTSQAKEFEMLVDCFREHPESFWQRNKRPAYAWDEKTFAEALKNFQLVPQADPNTASQTQRLMKVQALKMLQGASPSLYDPIACDIAALQALGWNNPQQFMAPASAQGQPPPELMKMKGETEAKVTTANAKMIEAQTKQQEVPQRLGLERQKVEGTLEVDKAHVGLDGARAAHEMAMAHNDMHQDNHQRNFDNRMKLAEAAHNIANEPHAAGLAGPIVMPAVKHQQHADTEGDGIPGDGGA